jgi:hypothetical protein
MTEWLMLLLLVPAVLVPVVLLLGFAGCDLVFGLKLVPSPPTGVEARALGTRSIEVSWAYTPTRPTSFQVRRTRDGMPHAVTHLEAGDTTTFIDDGLEEAITYFYRVVAMADGEESAPSEQVSATTFGVAFEAIPFTATESLRGRCLVQRVEPDRLRHAGSRVRIVLQRPTDNNLVLENITISRAEATGYDSATVPITIPATFPLIVAKDEGGGEMELPDVLFDLDPTVPLLVAFDIGSPGPVRRTGNVSSAEPLAYIGPSLNPPLHEAAESVRQKQNGDDPGYEGERRFYLVKRIEVV